VTARRKGCPASVARRGMSVGGQSDSQGEGLLVTMPFPRGVHSNYTAGNQESSHL